jgi:gamma-glutamyl-gamma-aminobutyrate hydrolase PuuD
MSRPIIGITSDLDAARWGHWLREAVVSPVSYTRAVERAGGAAVILPPVPPDSARAIAAGLAGLVFTGGADLDPALYEQAPHEENDPPHHRRDRFELALMRAALDGDVPFLAIGRGLHILNVARGGSLAQHLPAHRTDPLKYLPHDVGVVFGTRLAGLLGAPRITVPAAHHQAPDRPGSGLIVAARSVPGAVTEALEVEGHRFGLGVQWHPEEGDDPRLMTALVEAAAAAAGPKPAPPREGPGAARPSDVQARKVQAKAKAAARKG